MFQFAKFEKSKKRRLATELGYGFPIGDPWITDGISPWPFASESVLPSQCPASKSANARDPKDALMLLLALVAAGVAFDPEGMFGVEDDVGVSGVLSDESAGGLVGEIDGEGALQRLADGVFTLQAPGRARARV